MNVKKLVAKILGSTLVLFALCFTLMPAMSFSQGHHMGRNMDMFEMNVAANTMDLCESCVAVGDILQDFDKNVLELMGALIMMCAVGMIFWFTAYCLALCFKQIPPERLMICDFQLRHQKTVLLRI